MMVYSLFRDLYAFCKPTYLYMTLERPAARNVAIDAIDLKTPSFILIYVGFRTRSAHINVESDRQTLVKIALSGVQNILTYVHDIA